jgi:hypothetical protein
MSQQAGARVLFKDFGIPQDDLVGFFVNTLVLRPTRLVRRASVTSHILTRRTTRSETMTKGGRQSLRGEEGEGELLVAVVR